MTRRWPRFAVSAPLLAALAGGGAVTAEEMPDWLEAATRAPAATASPTRRVVLLQDMTIDLSRSRAESRIREAVRFLDTENFSAIPFVASQRARDRFRLIGAWRVSAGGKVQTYDRKSIVQVDADASYEFSKGKVNVFLPTDLRKGDVLGWEYEVKAPLEAYTHQWTFGGMEPTARSRFAVRTPDGWDIRATVRNHPGLSPARDDGGYSVWEMRGLEGLPDEPMSGAVRDRAPRLMVAYAPRGQAKRSFETWESVSGWYASIVAPQIVGDGSIRRTAAKLSAGKGTEIETIHAIAGFTQGIRYLDTAVGRSVAEPHPAPDILRNRFGDCEDKAILTIALLREVGVEAFPVLALTGGAGSVVPDFPSPMQFNHAIVAVRVPGDAATDLPATVDGGPLGWLVAFDPTNSTTGLGDLPSYLQGTHAVVAHGDRGGLVTLPVLPAEASTRTVERSVGFAAPSGIDVREKATYTGQYAASERVYYSEVRGAKRAERFQSWLKSHFGDGRVARLDVQGVESTVEPIVEETDFWMPLPGRDLGDLRILAMGINLQTRADRLPDRRRTAPLVIDSGYVETSRTEVVLPPGWGVVGALPSIEATSGIGDYHLDAALEEDRLVISRQLTVRAGRVPPEEYGAIREFFEKVVGGDDTGIPIEKRPD